MKKVSKVLLIASLAISLLSGGLAPLPAAQAAACPTLKPGDRFNIALNPSLVYILNKDSKRMYFYDPEVYGTWFGDYSGITTITDVNCVDAYPSAGGINYRPGSRLFKSPIASTIFAVGPGNTKYKMSETELQNVYGSNWKKLLRVLPDVFYANYPDTAGPISYDGNLITTAGQPVYFVKNNKLQKVVGALPKILADDLRTVSTTVFNTFTKDTATVTPQLILADPTQKGGLNLPLSVTAPTTAPTATSIVPVYSCVQVGKDIKIKRTATGSETLLTSECRDAGYGPKDYTLTCTSSTQYKVVSKACGVTPNADLINSLGVSNLSSSTPNFGQPFELYTGASYGDKMFYPWSVLGGTVGKNSPNLTVTINPKITPNTTYAVTYLVTSDSTTYSYFSTYEVDGMVSAASFTASTVVSVPTTNYKGKWVTIYAFARNNDGVSAIPGLTVEADDVAVTRVLVQN